VPLSPRPAGAPAASAVLPPLNGAFSHHPENRYAPRGAHENLQELISKISCPRYTRTSNYIAHIQQCMSMTQPNKPMTAKLLLELVRQSVVIPTYLRGLGGLPQQGAAGVTGSEGPGKIDPVAPATTEEAGGTVPPPG